MSGDFEDPKGPIVKEDGEDGVVGAAGNVGEKSTADWLRGRWYIDAAGGRMA